jgi:exodeoxyribonuclease VIII
MNNIMVDLETMGTGSNAAIVSIGAVEFDFEKNKVGKEFYQVVSLSDDDESGIRDKSTEAWWNKQSEEARFVLTLPGLHISEALKEFTKFVCSCGSQRNVKIWGNGSDFDNVILVNAYRRCNLSLPWEYWNHRCYRTVKNLFKDVKMVRSGTHHNALDDAKSQAEHLLMMLGIPQEVE